MHRKACLSVPGLDDLDGEGGGSADASSSVGALGKAVGEELPQLAWGAQRRKVERQVTPGAAGAQDIEDAVEHGPSSIAQAGCIRQGFARKLGARGGRPHWGSRVERKTLIQRPRRLPLTQPSSSAAW